MSTLFGEIRSNVRRLMTPRFTVLAAIMLDVTMDARYALRALARSPGFMAIAIVTLALGIGANVAIFSVVKAVLLEPLPYPEPQQLVSVWGGSRAEYVGLREQAKSFDAVGAYAPGQFNVGSRLGPARLTGAVVSSGLFQALKVHPLLGRAIQPGEERPGSQHVVVLSYGLWRDRFGGDAQILGRSIQIDGTAHTVVGVMPPRFAFPERARLWVPLTIDPSIRGEYFGTYGLRVIARLRAGVTMQQAFEDVRAVAERLRVENPVFTQTKGPYLARVNVVPLRQQLVGPSKALLLLLCGAAALVLLIACTNVANLLLVRGAAREREFAVRDALGAGRRRILRQLITESLLLSLLGTGAGITLAFALERALVGVLPAGIPRLSGASIDGRVLLFSAGLALIAGCAFGLAPALRSAGRGLRDSLVAGTRSTGPARRRSLAPILVAAEVALAIVLVIGATLLVRSLWDLSRVDPGFDAQNVISARVSLPAGRYTLEKRQVFWTQLLEALRTNRNITGTAATSNLPFDTTSPFGMRIGGYTKPMKSLSIMLGSQVSPDYLKVMGIPLVRGRRFTDADRAGSLPVAYVDENAAKRFWSGRDPIGGRVGYPWGGKWLTVVGVVGSVKTGDLTADASPAFYVPLTQPPVWNPNARASAMASEMVVLQAPDAARAISALRSTVSRLEPEAPVSDVRPLEQRVAASIAGPRSALLLLGAFATVALVLGVIGTYGVMAWVTARRTRELALRLALGASPTDVIALVTRQGALLALLGAAIGVVLALGLANLLRGMLFGVSTHDPLTFALVPVLLAAATMLATWIPARRAARLSPMVALREE